MVRGEVLLCGKTLEQVFSGSMWEQEVLKTLLLLLMAIRKNNAQFEKITANTLKCVSFI